MGRLASSGLHQFHSNAVNRRSDNSIYLNGIHLATLHARMQRDLTRSGELEECFKP
jgi:hypothetical protein